MKKSIKITLILLIIIILLLIIGYFSKGTFYIIKKQAGEASRNPSLGPNGNFGKCAKGLVEISTFYRTDPFCIQGEGGALICSDCGNGLCEEWENKCNCPEDCKIEDECQTIEDCPILENYEIPAGRCENNICYYH
jgi:hypothetical protein